MKRNLGIFVLAIFILLLAICFVCCSDSSSSSGSDDAVSQESQVQPQTPVHVCVEGAMRCNGNIPQICSGGQWENFPVCEYGCSDGRCVDSL